MSWPIGALTTKVPVVANVWTRPIHRQREADQAKWLLSLPGGDHLTLLNAYSQYRQSNSSLTSSLAILSKSFDPYRY